MRYFGILILLCCLCNKAIAEQDSVGRETGLPIPRFVSLKSANVNMRNGPGDRYPIKWKYRKYGYPIEIISEFDNWRKVRDIDGEDGWIHEALISGKRTGLVFNPDSNMVEETYTILQRKPNYKSYPLVKIETGVVVEILKCNLEWCRVKTRGYKGWLPKNRIWGIYNHEIFGK